MERLFKIVTDSSCDFPENYYEEHGVEKVSLGFNLDGENYLGEEGKYITDNEFYELLGEGKMPTTYQVTSEVAKLHIEKFLKQGQDVLIVAFSSGLSGTCSSFIVASRELKEKYPERKIEVIDSLCASLGEGLLLYYVMKKADEGATIEETKAYADELKFKIRHSFTVDDLFHLKRGGRISSATAVVGSILKIKPIMHVDDEGHLVAIGKTIGRKRSLSTLVESMEETNALEEGDPVFISYGHCTEDVERIKQMIEEKFPGHPILVNQVGPVIGAHSGIGTIAVFYRAKQR